MSRLALCLVLLGCGRLDVEQHVETHAVEVAIEGSGRGRITSEPAGIDCPGACAAEFAYGTAVRLVARPAADSSSVGWTAGCPPETSGDCTVVSERPERVTHRFDPLPECGGGVDGWALAGGGGGRDEVLAMATDSCGNLVVAGIFADELDLGDGIARRTNGAQDMFVASVTRHGRLRWVQTFGGTGGDTIQDLAIDASDSIVLAGVFESPTIDFGGGPLALEGRRDAFVVKLASDGSLAWSRRFGGAQWDFAAGVAIRNGDQIAVIGATGGGRFGGGECFMISDDDVWTALLDADGNAIWLNCHGGLRWDFGQALAVDPVSGDVVVTGFQGPSIDWGGGISTTSRGLRDVFVTRYAGDDGRALWARSFGDALTYPPEENPFADLDAGEAIAFDGDLVVVGGRYHGAPDFGFGPLPDAGTTATNGFVAGLDAVDGSVRWVHAVADPEGSDEVNAVAIRGDLVVAAGFFRGSVTVGGFTVTSAGGSDVWIALLGRDGTVRGTFAFGGPEDDLASALSFGTDGALPYFGGAFRAQLDASGSLLSSRGDLDAMLFPLPAP